MQAFNWAFTDVICQPESTIHHRVSVPIFTGTKICSLDNLNGTTIESLLPIILATTKFFGGFKSTFLGSCPAAINLCKVVRMKPSSLEAYIYFSTGKGARLSLNLLYSPKV